MTEITTTARRIARTMNTAPRGMIVAFDADGRELGRAFDPERRSDFHMPAAAHEFCLRQGRYTARQVQEHMDEAAEQQRMLTDPGFQAVAAEMAGQA